jgi:hypothetical protein
MFIMHYSYTFQVYHFEEHHKGYFNLSRETMFPFGTGSSVTTRERYCNRDAKLSEFIIDETVNKVDSDFCIMGYGLLMSQLKRQFLASLSPLKGT